VNLSAEADRRIRSLRPPKTFVDPFRAHGSLIEQERRPSGKLERTLTVFLAGAECPFACSFCDLWRWTIDGPTPRGALTRQLEEVVDRLDTPVPDRLKIYNASNFFDRRAVPPEDWAEIARIAAPFSAVTVESHASTIGPDVFEFSRLMDARPLASRLSPLASRLEVAVGLETIHPFAASQINKRLDIDRFDRAASFLIENGIELRVFVLIGVPFVPVEESVEWTVRAVNHAVGQGASIVSVIPVRGGNGELERLQALGHFTPPTLTQLEQVMEECCAIRASVVTVDLWDVDRIGACADCKPARVDRLSRFNLTGLAQDRVGCATCGVA